MSLTSWSSLHSHLPNEDVSILILSDAEPLDSSAKSVAHGSNRTRHRARNADLVSQGRTIGKQPGLDCYSKVHQGRHAVPPKPKSSTDTRIQGKDRDPELGSSTKDIEGEEGNLQRTPQS